MESKAKLITAKVLKTAMNKSAVVSVERLVKHPVNGNTSKGRQSIMFMTRIISVPLVTKLK